MNQNIVYDDSDNAIGQVLPTGDVRELAKQLATERGEMVYVLGNGREGIEPAPRVGVGCTIRYVTDRVAATVIAVSPRGQRVTVQVDRATRTDANGMSECQAYSFEPDASGDVQVFTRQGDGTYANRGRRLVLGVRSTYHDYSY